MRPVPVDETLAEAAIINAESNLGLEYMVPSTVPEEKANQYGGDNPETARTEDFLVKGYYARYPTELGDSLLTQISVKGGEHHLFGIYVGDNIEEAAVVLEQRGYETTSYIEAKPGTNSIFYEKYDVIIHLVTEVDSHAISEMGVSTYNSY